MVEFDRERALKSPARARTEKPARAQSSAPKPEPPAAPPAAAPIKAVSHVSSSNVTSPSTFTWLAPALLIAAGCLHAVIQEQLMHELGHLPLLITSFEFGSCAILSLLSLLVQKENPTDAPRFSLLRISLLVLASLVSGNVALKWVSYPVKVRAHPLLWPPLLLDATAPCRCVLLIPTVRAQSCRGAGGGQVVQAAAHDGARRRPAAQALLEV